MHVLRRDLQGKSEDPGVFPVLVAADDKSLISTEYKKQACVFTDHLQLCQTSVLTDNTLHELKLFAQVCCELLLAVVELHVLRRRLPQPGARTQLSAYVKPALN